MIALKKRSIIEVKGPQATEFLNNILTNNVDNATHDSAVYAALLGPQGKFLFDIFIIKNAENSYLLDCNDGEELFAKLRLFKLRMKLEINHITNELAVFANPISEDDYISFHDSRNANLGFRIFAPLDTKTDGEFEEYEILRFQNNIPDPSLDLIRDKDFALEARLDDMGAIDFHKGCYIGQEMTSRMKRRGTLKQNLQSFKFNGDSIAYDTPIMADETEIGRIRSNQKNHGMALVRIDRLKVASDNKSKLLAQGQEIFIQSLK